MRSSLVHDKELASGRVRIHGSCHGENTWCMLQVVFETVLRELTLDAVSRATHTGSVRASALDHKAVDDTMEDQTIIKSFFYKTDKIVYGIRCDFRIKLCFHHITIFHGNGYDRVCICHNHSLLL